MRLVRWLIRRASNIAASGATYGEIASMHAGPCKRCVGKAVVGPQESSAYGFGATPAIVKEEMS